MSLLQDPKRVVEQIEWYMQNKQFEKFAGGFSIAAGNLCRQLIEQILFIVSFYGELPKEKYITNDDKIKSPFNIINELKLKDKNMDVTYIEKAANKGKRIKKFSDKLNDFDSWRKLFNESSHFRNPIRVKRMEDEDVIKFLNSMKRIIDDKDCHLLTAAINEIKSNGKIKAVLCNDEDNTPGISQEVILGPKNIVLENGTLTIKYKKLDYYIVPDN